MSLLTEINTTAKAIEKENRLLADAEQNATSRREAIRLLEAKAARQAQTLAETKERISRQILDLTHTALVDILVAQGITCLGEDLVTPADIINDAADIFERTFWTTGSEVRTEAVASNEADLMACIPNDLKHFVAELPTGEWAAVTGVCSIGAIGLVRSMKADSPELKASFSELFEVDWNTRLATEAVARAMRAAVLKTMSGDQYHFIGLNGPETIIKANDTYLDKEGVIRAFREATSDPLLLADEIWTVASDATGPLRYVALPSEAAARALADALASGDHGHSVEASYVIWYHGSSPTFAPRRVATREAYDLARKARADDLVVF
jgi:hypothetical protein